jgi:hypothetical protein
MNHRPEVIPLRAHPPRHAPRARRRRRRFTPPAGGTPDPGAQRRHDGCGIRAWDANPDCWRLRLALLGDFQDVEWDRCPCEAEELGEGGGEVSSCG